MQRIALLITMTLFTLGGLACVIESPDFNPFAVDDCGTGEETGDVAETGDGAENLCENQEKEADCEEADCEEEVCEEADCEEDEDEEKEDD